MWTNIKNAFKSEPLGYLTLIAGITGALAVTLIVNYFFPGWGWVVPLVVVFFMLAAPVLPDLLTDEDEEDDY